MLKTVKSCNTSSHLRQDYKSDQEFSVNFCFCQFSILILSTHFSWCLRPNNQLSLKKNKRLAPKKKKRASSPIRPALNLLPPSLLFDSIDLSLAGHHVSRVTFGHFGADQVQKLSCHKLKSTCHSTVGADVSYEVNVCMDSRAERYWKGVSLSLSLSVSLPLCLSSANWTKICPSSWTHMWWLVFISSQLYD